ncbi:hypothetical protein F4861DRAFT_451472 [Xylaria intraflava]|nr:hypothetical protein F4861DRAFT_451472 [Xylaria intraflava]
MPAGLAGLAASTHTGLGWTDAGQMKDYTQRKDCRGLGETAALRQERKLPGHGSLVLKHRMVWKYWKATDKGCHSAYHGTQIGLDKAMVGKIHQESRVKSQKVNCRRMSMFRDAEEVGQTGATSGREKAARATLFQRHWPVRATFCARQSRMTKQRATRDTSRYTYLS